MKTIRTIVATLAGILLSFSVIAWFSVRRNAAFLQRTIYQGFDQTFVVALVMGCAFLLIAVILTVAIVSTGDPEEVRKYAYLAQRITGLLLKEQEYDARSRNAGAEIHYFVRSLVRAEAVNHDFYLDFLETHGIDESLKYMTVIVRLDRRYNPANLSMIEQEILSAFRQTESPLYTFEYPNEYILILREEVYRSWEYRFRRIAAAVQAAPTHGDSRMLFPAYCKAQMINTALLIPFIVSAHVSDGLPRLRVRKRMMISGPRPGNLVQVVFRHKMKDQVFRLIVHRTPPIFVSVRDSDIAPDMRIFRPLDDP